MISLELSAPFAAPPYLVVQVRADAAGAPSSCVVPLPIVPARFGAPWPISKEEYFGLWRGAKLVEAQAKFTFNAPHDLQAIKAMLSAQLRLAVLEGVDPSPNNLCAAGAVVCKGTPMPPAVGAQHCLLRLEIIPNYAKGPDGTPRAASRLTVRATHKATAETLVGTLASYLGG